MSELDTPERIVKLPRTQMRAWAARHLKMEQGGMCPVCGLEIDLKIKGEGVIDHDHTTGRIRGVLHRSCNAALGKVDNAAGRWGAKSMNYAAILMWLKRMVLYYEKDPTPWIYPMHKSDDEKKDDRNRKAREARAAIKAKRELLRQQRLGNQ